MSDDRRRIHEMIGGILRLGRWRAPSTTEQQGRAFADEMREAGFTILLRGVDAVYSNTSGAAEPTTWLVPEQK